MRLAGNRGRGLLQRHISAAAEVIVETYAGRLEVGVQRAGSRSPNYR